MSATQSVYLESSGSMPPNHEPQTWIAASFKHFSTEMMTVEAAQVFRCLVTHVIGSGSKTFAA